MYFPLPASHRDSALGLLSPQSPSLAEEMGGKDGPCPGAAALGEPRPASGAVVVAHPSRWLSRGECVQGPSTRALRRPRALQVLRARAHLPPSSSARWTQQEGAGGGARSCLSSGPLRQRACSPPAAPFPLSKGRGVEGAEQLGLLIAFLFSLYLISFSTFKNMPENYP